MNPSGVMTAAQAIRLECRYCTGAVQEKCGTRVCALHPGVSELRSSVKKIKAHCMDCAIRDLSGSVHQAVRDCTGQLLRENGNPVRWTDKDGQERGVCFLHPYRFGKNPTRAKYPSPPQRKRSATPARDRNASLQSRITTESEPRDGNR